MRHTVIHVIFSPQNLENTGKPSQKWIFSGWKHTMGKDGIIPCYDCYKPHMQAIVSWQEYVKNKEGRTSVANRLDAAKFQLIAKNWHYLKTILELLIRGVLDRLILAVFMNIGIGRISKAFPIYMPIFHGI